MSQHLHNLNSRLIPVTTTHYNNSSNKTWYTSIYSFKISINFINIIINIIIVNYLTITIEIIIQTKLITLFLLLRFENAASAALARLPSSGQLHSLSLSLSTVQKQTTTLPCTSNKAPFLTAPFLLPSLCPSLSQQQNHHAARLLPAAVPPSRYCSAASPLRSSPLRPYWPRPYISDTDPAIHRFPFTPESTRLRYNLRPATNLPPLLTPRQPSVNTTRPRTLPNNNRPTKPPTTHSTIATIQDINSYE